LVSLSSRNKSVYCQPSSPINYGSRIRDVCITTYLQEKKGEFGRAAGDGMSVGVEKAKGRGMVRMKTSDQNERPGRDVFASYAVWFSACFFVEFHGAPREIRRKKKVRADGDGAD